MNKLMDWFNKYILEKEVVIIVYGDFRFIKFVLCVYVCVCEREREWFIFFVDYILGRFNDIKYICNYIIIVINFIYLIILFFD